MKADCPERKTWMASRERERPVSASVESSGRFAAASASAATSTDPCLCTVSQAARGKLPRMYVNVSAPDYGATGIVQARVRSVVDTGIHTYSDFFGLPVQPWAVPTQARCMRTGIGRT